VVHAHVRVGAEFTDLFAIEPHDDDRVLRTPTTMVQEADRARRLQHDRGARAIVGDAVDPRVAMRADHHAVRWVETWQHADGVPQFYVVFNIHVDREPERHVANAV